MTVGSIQASFLSLTDSLKTITNTLFDLSYSDDPARKAGDTEAGVFGQEEKREGPSGLVIQDALPYLRFVCLRVASILICLRAATLSAMTIARSTFSKRAVNRLRKSRRMIHAPLPCSPFSSQYVYSLGCRARKTFIA